MKSSKKPNFLIVGAAKSGTTALANYLNQHPDIYIPSIKEPRFFIKDTILSINDADPLKNHLLKTSVLNEDDYLRLYDTPHKMKGDASVHYLNDYKEAIPKIKKLLGDVPIIIILRNPIERLISNYNYNKARKLDNSIDEAIKNESKKKLSGFNSFWFLKESGLYFEKIKAYKDNFTNVQIYIFEDFIENPDRVCRHIFKQFDIDDSISKNIDYRVPNKTTESNLLFHLLSKAGIVSLFKKSLKVETNNNKTAKWVKKNLLQKKASSHLTQDLRNELIKYFEKDVFLLKNQYQLNLNKWKKDFSFL